jgi:hypothetical protein
MACTTDEKLTQCGAIAIVSPVITITNSAQQPICDATVIATCADSDAGAAVAALGPDGYPVDASAADCTCKSSEDFGQDGSSAKRRFV